MAERETSEAKERVLEVAERLFMERGYAAVKLRDIASELHIKQASLYHHVPGGKEALFVEVVQRAFERHQHGLNEAISNADDTLHGRLMAAAGWLLSQPSMNFGRMFRSDMPSISEENAMYLGRIAYQTLMEPLQSIFRAALGDSDEAITYANIYAGSFLTVVEGFNDLPDVYANRPREEITGIIVDLFINGIRKF